MRNKPKRGIRLGFELLEVRFVLSGTPTTDPDPDPPSQLVDECTLRAAIEQANATEGYQTIGFASHSVGSGSFVVNSEGDASDSDLSDNKCWTGAQISPSTVEKIVPGSPYDPITDPAAIDATPQGSFGNPNVEIDGSQTTDAHGFVLAADTSLIGGLIINQFDRNGIEIVSNSNFIAGNFIGTNRDGSLPLPNGLNGIRIAGDSNRIGIRGSVYDFNVVSGNTKNGIAIESGTGNSIETNYVGTTSTSLEPLPNALAGVLVEAGAGETHIGPKHGDVCEITIGQQIPCVNVLSGNDGHGLHIKGPDQEHSQVQGNRIGVNADGDAAVPNKLNGVFIEQKAAGIEINDNVISGNEAHGIHMKGEGTDQMWIHSNQIGVALDGSSPIENEGDGIFINDKSKEHILGVDGRVHPPVGQGNTISGNTGHGIRIDGSGKDYTWIAGNIIGTNQDVDTKLPNGKDGIHIEGTASHINIGADEVGPPDHGDPQVPGSQAEERNVISGNQRSGVHIAAEANTIRVTGNYIGTNRPDVVAGGGIGIPTLDLGNTLDGVTVHGSNNWIGSNGNGKYDLDESNVIAGNDRSGVVISGVEATGNQVSWNRIGLPSIGNGTQDGEDGHGVHVTAGASNTVIGKRGNTDEYHEQGNIIVANFGSGVKIEDSGTVGGDFNGDGLVDAADYTLWRDGQSPDSTAVGWALWALNYGKSVHTTVTGNTIGGTEETGNQQHGVDIENAKAAAIGSLHFLNENGAAGNDIAGNAKYGVHVINSENVSIQGNGIGHGLTNVYDGNRSGGIYAENTKRLRIGITISTSETPADLLEGNTISNNGGHGIHINGGRSTFIVGNRIGVDPAGMAAAPNDGDGIFAEGTVTGLEIGTIKQIKYANDLTQGNTISANQHNGIRINGPEVTSVRVTGNRIGTNHKGEDSTVDLGNKLDGVRLESGAMGITIGGNKKGDDAADGKSQANVISGNHQNGVRLVDAGTMQNKLLGNRIGVGRDGTTPIGNRRNGVRIEAGAADNEIGLRDYNSGLRPGFFFDGSVFDREANIIAHNGRDLSKQGHGIVIVGAGTTGNTVRMNSIHTNSGRGIDLGDDSFTVNDPNGEDLSGNKKTSSNRFQDYPVLRRAHDSATNSPANWMLDSHPNESFVIDFYSNDVADPSGFGEAKKFLGGVAVTTGDHGNFPCLGVHSTTQLAEKRACFDPGLPADSKLVSAIVTRESTGDTSEISMVDTDGDGLADQWELLGIDYDEQGNIDHKLTGANPAKLDIYVEVDVMENKPDQELSPTAADLAAVAGAFSAKGITLHSELDEDDLTNENFDAPTGLDFTKTWESFEKIKKKHFGTKNERNSPATISAKQLTHRYAIFGHAYDGSSGGTGEMWGDDFFVTLGLWKQQDSNATAPPDSERPPGGGGAPREKQGTYMHELGHTLGLAHGGSLWLDEKNDEDVEKNYKPNYHSVMNYLWQTPCEVNDRWYQGWTLDYSAAQWPKLKEATFDEWKGVSYAGQVNGQRQDHGNKNAVFPVDPTNPVAKCHKKKNSVNLHFVPEAGQADWDNDNNIDTQTKADLNQDGDTNDTLHGNDDWAAVPFFLYFVEQPNHATTFLGQSLESDHLLHEHPPTSGSTDPIPPDRPLEVVSITDKAIETLFPARGNLDDFRPTQPPRQAALSGRGLCANREPLELVLSTVAEWDRPTPTGPLRSAQNHPGTNKTSHDLDIDAGELEDGIDLLGDEPWARWKVQNWLACRRTH